MVDSLPRWSNQTRFNLFFGKFDQLLFDHARLWRPEVTPFFGYSAKMGKNWIIKQEVFKKLNLHKWHVEIPHALPLSGISFGTKLRHKNRLPFFGRLYLRLWQWMSGVGKSQWRLTKVAFIVARNCWNQWSIGFSTIHHSSRVEVCW